MIEDVILVDSNDEVTGTMEKLQAHKLGQLHRAFSVFIFNSNGELLLQKRAQGKYHSEGRWSNTCCSHPRPGEDISAAAHRRLQEEMGIKCKLEYIFKFTYFAQVSDNLAEHEIDHVFFGASDDMPVLNTDEASGFKYISMEMLQYQLEKYPEEYTKWLGICFNKVYSLYKLFVL